MCYLLVAHSLSLCAHITKRAMHRRWCHWKAIHYNSFDTRPSRWIMSFSCWRGHNWKLTCVTPAEQGAEHAVCLSAARKAIDQNERKTARSQRLGVHRNCCQFTCKTAAAGRMTYIIIETSKYPTFWFSALTNSFSLLHFFRTSILSSSSFNPFHPISVAFFDWFLSIITTLMSAWTEQRRTKLVSSSKCIT